MAKPKILIVHNYYQIPGGEDTVVANEKLLLEKNGHEVFFYSRDNTEIKKMNIFQKLFLPIQALFNFRVYRDVRRIIKENHIDIVHVHNTLSLISPSVYYAAKRCRIPVVQTIHNFRLLCPGATFYRDEHVCEDCIKRGLLCAVIHGCYRGSRLQTSICVVVLKLHKLAGIYKKINYICLTEFNKKKLLTQKQILPEKVYLKPNFAEDETRLIPYKDRKKQFVFVGRTDRLKGIDLLLRAWREIEKKGTDSKLIICGGGSMEQWCKRYIADMRLKAVEMTGFISNVDVRKIISISRALILPTRWYEGFPMVIVEAYSAGTPVIGSDIGNVGDLIQEGITGYRFKHDSLEDLQHVIEKKNFDICESTRRVYIENYTKEKNYQKLMDIYRKVRSTV